MLWLCMIVTILLLLFSAQTMLTAHQTAVTFARSVMPALFPMMIVGHLLAHHSPSPKKRTNIFFKQIMFGFLAGSPASTRQLSFLAEQHELPRRDYRMLLCMSGVMSPMFFTGALASRLGSGIAWLILICHWAAALLTGLGYAIFTAHALPAPHADKGNTAPPKGQPSRETTCLPPSPAFAATLTAAIREAALAQLSVLGAMMVFSILASLCRESLMRLFPRWTATHGLLLSVGWSLMEIGGGVLALLEEAPAAPPWLVCGLCSFGGLSIWLQNLLFLDNQTHPAELLGFRTLHGVIAMILCAGASRWLPAAPAMAQATDALSASGGISVWLPLLILIALALHRPWA